MYMHDWLTFVSYLHIYTQVQVSAHMYTCTHRHKHRVCKPHTHTVSIRSFFCKRAISFLFSPCTEVCCWLCTLSRSSMLYTPQQTAISTQYSMVAHMYSTYKLKEYEPCTVHTAPIPYTYWDTGIVGPLPF